MSKKVRIERVWIQHAVDESPDLSWLGEYGAHEGNEWCIDRADRGDQTQGEYRYWEPGDNHTPGEPNNWSHVTDDEVQAALTSAGLVEVLPRAEAIRQLDLYYVERDYQRCEAYNRGDWHMLGIIAKAEIITPSEICQTIRSGGLWGVESDSGADYLEEVTKAELAGLRAELEVFGLGTRAIDYAFQNVKQEFDR